MEQARTQGRRGDARHAGGEEGVDVFGTEGRLGQCVLERLLADAEPHLDEGVVGLAEPAELRVALRGQREVAPCDLNGLVESPHARDVVMLGGPVGLEHADQGVLIRVVWGEGCADMKDAHGRDVPP